MRLSLTSNRKMISSQLIVRAGVMFLTQLFGCYALASILFLCSASVSPVLFPIALIGGWGIASIGCGSRERAGLALAAAAAWTVAICSGMMLWDFSYDGNAYHQESIAALCEGWNPVHPQPQFADLSIWSLHYAKGLEIIEATVVSTTGLLESGKAVNFILALSAALYAYEFIRRQFPAVDRRISACITLLAVCNPVFITQAPTFYIDYAKYFYTLLSIISIIDWVCGHHHARALLTLVMVIQLAVATKFNAFFEEGIVIATALIWLIIKGHARISAKLAGIALIAALAGVLPLGYHPYITNTLTAGHPLFPLMGSGSVDIMSYNTPDVFAEGNRFTNFLLSMTYPLLPKYDSRMGGFGPLFSIMMAISLVVLWRSHTRYRPVTLYIAGVTLVSCFFFEQSWWARYICQAWLIFPLAAIVACTSPRDKAATGWLLGCGALTLLLCLPSYYSTLKLRAYRNAIFSTLSGKAVKVQHLNRAYARQLTEHDVTPLPTESDCPATLIPLPYYGSTLNPENPIMQLTREQYDEIFRNLSTGPFASLSRLKRRLGRSDNTDHYPQPGGTCTD